MLLSSLDIGGSTGAPFQRLSRMTALRDNVIGKKHCSLQSGKCEGANRITGNLSVRSQPLAPSQLQPRVAIASDVPRGAASSLVLAGPACPPRDRDRRPSAAAVPIWWRRQSARRIRDTRRRSPGACSGLSSRQFLPMLASRLGKFTLEKMRLSRAVEADLKPDTAVNLGDRQERS